MKNSYTIRQAIPSDEASLKQLLATNGQKPTIRIDDRSVFYVAHANGSNVGMIGAELCGTIALIRSAAVLSAWRGNGIANDLFVTIVDDLRKRGITQLYLLSRHAGGYWQKFGFEGCDVREVIENLADTPQVAGYMEDGSIWTDVAWRRPLS